jgi:hypothetical protein
MENVATYSEARSEYTKQLSTFIVPVLVNWFQQLWQRNAANKQQALILFQTECEEIPRWNTDRVHDEARILIDRTGCDYMEELVTAVFIAHTKVLTAVRLSSQQKKLSITVPKLDHFIHRIFREAARSFWKTPFLFMSDGPVMERQKNILQIEALATEAITTAVRSLLPVKQILRDYLEGDQEEIAEDDFAAPAAVNAPILATAAAAADDAETTPEKEEPAAESTQKEVEVQSSQEPDVASDSPSSSASAPASEEASVPDLIVKDVTIEKEAAPNTPAQPVVKIDTEHSVRFSEFDTVFDEAEGSPHIRPTQTSSAEEIDEDDMYGSSGTLDINEATSSAVSDDDVEYLEPKPTQKKPVKAPVSETLGEEELIVLD